MTAEPIWQGAESFRDRLVPIDKVKPFPGNPRRGDIEAIAKSLRRFGQQRTLLVQKSTGYIVAGNHLFEAARMLGWSHIAVDYTDLDDTEARAYLLADNQLSARGQNDADALQAFVRDLHARGGIDEAIGFESEQLDRFLLDIGADTLDDAPALPEPKDIYVQSGDIWQMGQHRLIVGDATQPETYERLLGDETVDIIWTDPPYGVSYLADLTAEEKASRYGSGNVGAPIANDDLNEIDLRLFLGDTFRPALEHLKPGGAFYCCAASTNADVFVGILKALGVYHQTLTWVKDQLVLGRSDYQWRHEAIHLSTKPSKKRAKEGSPVHYGWRPGAAHYFVSDRTLDTVWEIPRPKRSKDHPTQKPVELIERSLVASSRRGDIVLDMFAGSGSTVVAADHAHRVARAIEIDPAYGQVVVERWQARTGLQAQKL